MTREEGTTRKEATGTTNSRQQATGNRQQKQEATGRWPRASGYQKLVIEKKSTNSNKTRNAPINTRTKYSFCDEKFLARLERLHLAGKHIASRWSAGLRRSRRLGDGLEFADHRDYSAGDDIRFIDWAFYARMEKLLLRLFHEHSEADVAILLDVSASMAPAGDREKFDHARRLAAALAFVAMGSLERVILLPFAGELGSPLRSGRNRSAILKVLDFLEDLAPGGQTDLSAVSRRLMQAYPSAGVVLVLSDLLNSADQLPDALARLSAGSRDVTILHTYAVAEADPRLAGPTLLRWAEGPARLNLDISPELLEQYRGSWKEFQESCRRACVARGVVYVPAPTNLPMEELLLSALRKAGVLAD